MKARKITSAETLACLKSLSAVKRWHSGGELAECLGTDAQNVATALRLPIKRGQVQISFPKKLRRAVYRFVRMSYKSH